MEREGEHFVGCIGEKNQPTLGYVRLISFKPDIIRLPLNFTFWYQCGCSWPSFMITRKLVFSHKVLRNTSWNSVWWWDIVFNLYEQFISPEKIYSQVIIKSWHLLGFVYVWTNFLEIWCINSYCYPLVWFHFQRSWLSFKVTGLPESKQIWVHSLSKFSMDLFNPFNQFFTSLCSSNLKRRSRSVKLALNCDIW